MHGGPGQEEQPGGRKMEISLEFMTLTKAEQALDYYENQAGQPRCMLVPVPSVSGVIWRLEVKPPMDISARNVAPEFGTRTASVGAA
jgi:hypothetical protein